MKRLFWAAAVAASATLPGAEGVRNAEVVTVQAPPGYNAWPMIQAAGERVVCAYSRGAAHNTYEGRRDAAGRHYFVQAKNGLQTLYCGRQASTVVVIK